jgi:hypothetical protein
MLFAGETGVVELTVGATGAVVSFVTVTVSKSVLPDEVTQTLTVFAPSARLIARILDVTLLGCVV